tara:strand:- start:259 stop:1521 length:1263 start_codon:yes stop_codon:yes gene_type:complete
MNIGIIGSGGREHALCFKLKQSKIVDKIYCMPGNAGTNLIAENIEIQINDFEKIKKISIEKKIELLVIGPEKPLVDGISDYFKNTNIKIFGPNKIASKLEGSKTFTKKLCKKYNIPTSKFDIFENKKDAKKFLSNSIFPLVIKADGLAAGKGVYICNNSSEALNSVDEIFDGRFGKADCILIEEFLKGEEMSYFIITDGKTFKPFQTAQDHKRVGEGDVGKNTGGMGAYSPSRLINNELQNKIDEKIVKPTLKGLNDLNCDYIGFLYVGLMIINNEPFLIEFNVRMGDPECQTILPLLNSDLGKIINACCIEKLSSIEINWLSKKSLCIVLCSNGYPDKYNKDIKIENLNKIKLNKNSLIFHAGTKLVNKDIFAIGGRVLNIVNVSNNFNESKKQTLTILKDINWTKGFYRKDIGYKVIS